MKFITNITVVASTAKTVVFTATVQEVVFLPTGAVAHGAAYTETGTIDFDPLNTDLQTITFGG